MSEEKFESLLASLTVSEIKQIIKDYNDTCVKEDRKGEKMRGYSRLNKDGLIDFVITSLSEKEIQRYYEKYSAKYMNDLTRETLELINGTDKRERIEELNKLPEEDGYEVIIKGIRWEETASVAIEGDIPYGNCSCRIGRSFGLCRHQMVIFLKLIDEGRINPEDLPFKTDESWKKIYEDRVDAVSSKIKLKEDADVVFAGNYRIYVDEDNEIVTVQWEGEYPGKKIYEIKDEKPADVESWVVEQVLDKILKPIKITKKEGSPRPLKVDRYGVIAKIFHHEKTRKKLIRYFETMPDLPNEEQEIYEYLQKSLETNENPESYIKE